MQKLLPLIALAIFALACTESQASARRVRTSTSQVNTGQYQNQYAAQGPFARLMEMERAKNAALRQMFFGR